MGSLTGQFSSPTALSAEKSPFDIILITSVVTAIGAYLFCQIWDYDIWWHVVIGKEILASRTIPVLDHFAAAALGRPYHDSHWLFQVVAALAHHTGRMTGVQLMAATVWGVTLVFSYKSIARWVSLPASALILLLLAMASLERFLPRPEIVTYLMIAIYYHLLQQEHYRKTAGLITLTVLQIVWTNSHGLFVLGPFMTGCYWLAAAVAGIRKEKNTGLDRLTLLMLLLLAASVVTPYGIGNWQYAWLLFTEVGGSAPLILQRLGELSPTFGRDTASGVAFWFYVTLVAATLGTITAKTASGKISLARLFMITGFFLLSLSGRRNMVLFALIAGPFLGENLSSYLPARLPLPGLLKIFPILLATALAFFSFSGSYQRYVNMPARVGLGATPLYFPHELPAFLERIGYHGQVFNSNTLGGFYLYHGYPRLIPFTDGRWEIYDPKLFDSDVPTLVKRFGIDAFLLQHTCPDAREIYPSLVGSPDWRLVYYDYTASFWLKAGVMPEVPAIDAGSPESLPPASSFIENYRSLEQFFRHAGNSPARIANLERALQAGDATEHLYEQLGTMQTGAGALAAAEKTFTGLLARYPKNSTAYNGLAFIAAEQGNLALAEKVLSQGLQAIPGNRELTANLKNLRKSKNSGIINRTPPR